MLLMIRINLIGTGKTRRRRAVMPDIPNVGVLFFMLLLIVESAVLYSWHASAVEQSANLSQKLNRFNHELTSLEKTNDALKKLETEVKGLERNTTLFEELTAEKIGPVNALTYLAFSLQRREEASYPASVLKRLEAAGWRVEWNAERAWFTSIRESRGEVTLKGRAIDHEDVAEVLRRLESSAYFRDVRLVFQEAKNAANINANYVEFTIKAALVYLIEPQTQETAEDAQQVAQAPVEEASEGDQTGARRPSEKSMPQDNQAGGKDKPAMAVKGETAGGIETVGRPGLSDLIEATLDDAPAPDTAPGSAGQPQAQATDEPPAAEPAANTPAPADTADESQGERPSVEESPPKQVTTVATGGLERAVEATCATPSATMAKRFGEPLKAALGIYSITTDSAAGRAHLDDMDKQLQECLALLDLRTRTDLSPKSRYEQEAKAAQATLLRKITRAEKLLERSRKALDTCSCCPKRREADLQKCVQACDGQRDQCMARGKDDQGQRIACLQARSKCVRPCYQTRTSCLRTLPDNEWRARLGATEAAYKRSVVMSKQEMNDKLSEFKRALPPELRRSVDIADAKTWHLRAVKAAESALKSTYKELAGNLKSDDCAPKNVTATLRASILRCGDELRDCQATASGDAEAIRKCNHEASLCRATCHAEKLRCRREHKEMAAETAELKREAKADHKRSLAELKASRKRKLLLAKRLFEYAEQPELRALDEARDSHLRKAQRLSESYHLSRRELAEESKRAACRAVSGASKGCLQQCANEVATCAREARGDRSYQQGCVRDNKRCRVDCRKEAAETVRRCNAEALAVRARVKKKLASLKVEYRKQIKDADRQLASTLKSMRAQIKRAKGGGH